MYFRAPTGIISIIQLARTNLGEGDIIFSQNRHITLSVAQLAQYEAEGYLIVPDVLAASELAALTDRVDGLLEGRYQTEACIVGAPSNGGAQDVGRLIKQVMPTRFPIHDAVLRAYSEHAGLKHIAAQLLRAEQATVFQQQALVKDPGQNNPTPWHQDDHYWGSDGRAVTAWFPLEPLFPDSGTMWVVPRSHAGEVLRHAAAGGVSAFHAIQNEFDESSAVPLLMEQGSVSFHHSKLIHGARGNNGHVRRIAMAQHYHAVTTETV